MRSCAADACQLQHASDELQRASSVHPGLQGQPSVGRRGRKTTTSEARKGGDAHLCGTSEMETDVLRSFLIWIGCDMTS